MRKYDAYIILYLFQNKKKLNLVLLKQQNVMVLSKNLLLLKFASHICIVVWLLPLCLQTLIPFFFLGNCANNYCFSKKKNFEISVLTGNRRIFSVT